MRDSHDAGSEGDTEKRYEADERAETQDVAHRVHGGDASDQCEGEIQQHQQQQPQRLKRHPQQQHDADAGR